MENYIEEILKVLELSPEELAFRAARGKKSITFKKLIKECLRHKTLKDLEKPLDRHTTTISRRLRTLFDKPPGHIAWQTYFLGLINHRKCIKCNIIKPLEEFNSSTSEYLQKNHRCKSCTNDSSKKRYQKTKDRHKALRDSYYQDNKPYIAAKHKTWRQNNKEKCRHYDAKRRAAKLKRTPAWANLDKIKQIYKDCPEGYEVDHIIPLQGANVSGLHVEDNLQYLTPTENRSKNNKW